MPRASLAIAACALLMGCAHHPVSSTPFFCVGMEEPEGEALASTAQPPRLLEVARRGDAAPDWSAWRAVQAQAAGAPAASAWGEVAAAPPEASASGDPVLDWYERAAAAVRLHVVADAAPLSSMAVALSSATGLDVTVQPDLTGLPITVSLVETTLASLQDTLRDDYGVWSIFQHGVLHLLDNEQYLQRRYQPQVAPLQVLLLDIPEGAAPAEVAATWCAQAASPRGSAAVLGDRVSFRDVPPGLQRASELVQALSVAPVAAQ